MATTSAPVSAIFMEKVADWLTQAALSGSTLEDIVRGFATGSPPPVCRSFGSICPLPCCIRSTKRLVLPGGHKVV